MAKKLLHNGRELKNKKTKKLTHLIAIIEKINEIGNKLITLQIECKGLPKMDGLFGKGIHCIHFIFTTQKYNIYNIS